MSNHSSQSSMPSARSLPDDLSRSSSESSPARRNSLDRALSRRSSQHGKTLRGIAMKQLSQNLTRQDSDKAQRGEANAAPAGGFRARRLNLSMSLIDCTSESFATVENKFVEDSNSKLTPIAEVLTPVGEDNSNIFKEQNGSHTSAPVAPVNAGAAPAGGAAKKGRRPNLQLALSENEPQTPAAIVPVPVALPQPETAQAPSKAAPGGRRRPNLQVVDSDPISDMDQHVANQVDKQLPPVSTPNHPTISPRGTFLLGDIRINQEGIRPKSDQQKAPVMRGMDFLEVRPLGNGASGVVMEAIHVPTLTIVALKMLPVYSQEKCENLSRELMILYKNLAALSLVDNSLDENSSGSQKSSLKCPNLLSLFNAFVNVKNGMVCMVMEYMDGGSLDDLVKNGGCNDEYVLSDIARQGLNGLAFLHKNKSVHRDIKPANILCSSNGIIKIADFGISKVMDEATGFAKTFVGTVIYMSPERITASSYGYPSDIWSFGLTLLAVANGSFPLRMNGESEGGQWGGSGGYWGMVEAVCDNEPPTTGPEFSNEFSEFIKSCLRKSPTERGTAEQLLQHEFIHNYISPNSSGNNIYCPSPKNSNISSDDEHGQLSASLTNSMVKRVVSKEKKAASRGISPRMPSLDEAAVAALKEEEAEIAAEEEEDLVSIEAIRTKHLENIVTKMIFRDHIEDDYYSAKYGGSYVKGKLIRKESTLDDDGNLQEIDNVDDLFGGKKQPESYKLSKINSDQAMKKFDRNYSDLITSILRLQGAEYENNIETSLGLTTKAHMPKLFGPDLQKWQNLARQLHLPIDHVVQVVESKLNETLEKLRQELGEEEEQKQVRRPSLSKGDSEDVETDSRPTTIMHITSTDVLDALAPFDPAGKQSPRDSAKASPQISHRSFHDVNLPKSPVTTALHEHTNSPLRDSTTELLRNRSGSGDAPSCTSETSESEDVNPVNSNTGDYGACASVIGVFHWFLEGLAYPLGINYKS